MTTMTRNLAHFFLALGVVIAVVFGGTAEAEAATRSCVSKAEYRRIAHNMTPAQVQRVTGARGTVRATHKFDETFDLGYYDEMTHEGDTATGEWVENLVTMTFRDSLVTYPRCSGGRMGILFDNYAWADPEKPTMTVALKTWRNPRALIWW